MPLDSAGPVPRRSRPSTSTRSSADAAADFPGPPAHGRFERVSRLLTRPAVCIVTDRRELPAPQDDSLVRLVAAAAACGVPLVQVRERGDTDRRLLDLVRRLVRAADGSATRIVVNDRLDIALAAGAHGVHLPADSVPAVSVRQLVPSGFLVGRSVHSPGEAAAAGPVDYVVFGTVFATPGKPSAAPAGLQHLAAAAAATPVPVLAIGGITTDNVDRVARSGAAGIAGIRLFAECAADGRDPVDGMRAIMDAVRRAFAGK